MKKTRKMILLAMAFSFGQSALASGTETFSKIKDVCELYEEAGVSDSESAKTFNDFYFSSNKDETVASQLQKGIDITFDLDEMIKVSKKVAALRKKSQNSGPLINRLVKESGALKAEGYYMVSRPILAIGDTETEYSGTAVIEYTSHGSLEVRITNDQYEGTSTDNITWIRAEDMAQMTPSELKERYEERYEEFKLLTYKQSERDLFSDVAENINIVCDHTNGKSVATEQRQDYMSCKVCESGESGVPFELTNEAFAR
jgi:hypothetical protein